MITQAYLSHHVDNIIVLSLTRQPQYIFTPTKSSIQELPTMYNTNRFVQEKVEKQIVFFQKYSQNSSNLVQSNVNHEIKPKNIDTFVLL